MKKTALIMTVILMMMAGCRQSKSVPCNEVQQNSEYSDSIEAEAMEKWDSLHDSCFVEGLNGNETKDSFTVIYRQPVNGYKVLAVVKKEEQRIGLVADLTFTKGDKSFTLYTTSFGDTVFNKGGWGMDGTNDELMEKYRGKTVEADYHENRVDGETFSGFTPFFFRDLDFDGVDELVIVHYSIAVRYHSGYDVYRIVDGTPVLIDYPPYKTHDDFGMTDYPEFNYRQKTISCPYPEGPGGQRYIGCTIYGVSRTRKDTVAVNGREYYFNHLEPVTNAR